MRPILRNSYNNRFENEQRLATQSHTLKVDMSIMRLGHFTVQCLGSFHSIHSGEAARISKKTQN